MKLLAIVAATFLLGMSATLAATSGWATFEVWALAATFAGWLVVLLTNRSPQ